MKIYKFLGGNIGTLYFHETETKFLVHKSLINCETRDMINQYMASLYEPDGVIVMASGNTRIFTPVGAECSANPQGDDAYLPFAL